MKLCTMGFNKMRELEDYVNEHRIPKEDIINIIVTKDNDIQLIYYADE